MTNQRLNTINMSARFKLYRYGTWAEIERQTESYECSPRQIDRLSEREKGIKCVKERERERGGESKR